MTDKNMKEYAKRIETAFSKIMKKLGPEMSKLAEGLTPPQFFVLKLLQTNGRTVTEIAELMNVQPSAITAILDRMYRNGFIIRERNETDRRVVLVQITEKGKEAFVKSQQKRQDVMLHFLSYLEKEDLDALLAIYEKMAKIVERHSNKTSS
ncbi:transcriptional regulator, MarR family [Desulforamulus reducens MI-1]|uniref:Transcriptional regulator, MarR family n=1 Tax=Desulforamulus reducens (strain ATCC BAA-1160 / DSM 100696 / MI-1) TaxID=349161 RepID=A4J1C0_DESRM|nr:MarR family transcriptional regulator [Desulforamulus reducens]ABO48873.1 transcriptional regulator, MarR family [Desulforamulus reducens MI-1]